MKITRELLLTEKLHAQQRHQELVAKANAEAGVISALDMLLGLESQSDAPPPTAPAPVIAPASA